MSSILGFSPDKVKNGEISPNRAQLFLRNKYRYTVFTMGGIVALRSDNNFFSGELQLRSLCSRCRTGNLGETDFVPFLTNIESCIT